MQIVNIEFLIIHGSSANKVIPSSCDLNFAIFIRV